MPNDIQDKTDFIHETPDKKAQKKQQLDRGQYHSNQNSTKTITEPRVRASMPLPYVFKSAPMKEKEKGGDKVPICKNSAMSPTKI